MISMVDKKIIIGNDTSNKKIIIGNDTSNKKIYSR
jgi:hypothetical protein